MKNTRGVKRAKVVPLGVALIGATTFLIFVLTPGCAFNFLPYELHESMRPTRIQEAAFIIVFDIIFSIGLFSLIYWIVYPMIKTKKQPKQRGRL